MRRKSALQIWGVASLLPVMAFAGCARIQGGADQYDIDQIECGNPRELLDESYEIEVDRFADAYGIVIPSSAAVNSACQVGFQEVVYQVVLEMSPTEAEMMLENSGFTTPLGPGDPPTFNTEVFPDSGWIATSDDFPYDDDEGVQKRASRSFLLHESADGEGALVVLEVFNQLGA